MEIRDALYLIHRIESLPEIYGQIESAVCAVMHSYFDEMLEVERDESAVMQNADYSDDELDQLLKKKRLIHEKYWSNKTSFYRSCSSSSEPDHIWKCLFEIEILQNGDDDNSLFIFKANYKKAGASSSTVKAFLLKLSGSSLKIEHEFFG